MEKWVSVFHALSKSLETLHKDSCEEVSVVQSTILYEISQLQKPSMQEVAEKVGMDITTFSRQIATLVKKGLVIRTPCEEDRRIHILSLSKKGEVTVESINVIIAARLESTFATMNDFERDIVMKSMQVLSGRL